LTALHALQSIPLTLPPIRRSRAPLISWWAPISASPRRGAPRSAALSSAGGECASTSDTPCRDVLRAFRRAARRRDRLPPDLVKGRSFGRSRVPSIDECPHRPAALPFERNDSPRARARHRCPGLAARDPASDALSPARSRGRRWLDRGRYRALFTPGRSWPRAARRLLQSKRPASTTSRPRNPMRMEAARLSPSSSPAAPVRISMGPRRFPDTIPTKRSRVVTGQGPFES
jgi:hypothetical protein